VACQSGSTYLLLAMTCEMDTTDLIDTGGAGPALVCLHGWCCRTGDFAAQVNLLGERYRVFVPDWIERIKRGDTPISLEAVCHDLASLLRRHGIKHPVFCGHSMGGFLAASLANTKMVDCRAVIVMDSSIPLSIATQERYAEFIRRLQQGPYGEVFRSFVEQAFFLPCELGPIVESIVQGMMAQSPEIAMGLFADLASFGARDLVSNIGVPLHLMVTACGHLDVAGVQAGKPDATASRLDDVGHFLTYFAADRVCAAMEDAAR